jgi:hypothetical protein
MMSPGSLEWRRPAAPGTVVLAVSFVGEAEGSLEIAAALTCAGSASERAGLLVEVGDGRRPRQGLVASAAARGLEERLGSHLPGLGVASRGVICRLAVPSGGEGLDAIRAALPLVRDSMAALHLAPGDFEQALGVARPNAAVLRADLARDRPLAALAARGVIDSGLRVAIAKRELPWLASRRALLGLLGPGSRLAGVEPALLRMLGDSAPIADAGSGRGHSIRLGG